MRNTASISDNYLALVSALFISLGTEFYLIKANHFGKPIFSSYFQRAKAD